jgi:CheY-like chemotaxis protein
MHITGSTAFMDSASNDPSFGRTADGRGASASSLPLRFLVVDDNPDGRVLVSRTLLRKFPTCVVLECGNGTSAVKALAEERISAVVSHRTFDFDGVTLVRELRKINASIPIIMTSGVDQESAALLAGASRFILNEQWLLIATAIADLLSIADAKNSSVDQTAS